MRIAVMARGAIGGYVGARLAAAGAKVSFVARGRHLAAIRDAGLKVSSPLGDVHIDPASATDDPAAVGEVDVVLLGTKLYDVEAAARAIAPMLGGETAVICVQNGVDATDMACRGPGRPRWRSIWSRGGGSRSTGSRAPSAGWDGWRGSRPRSTTWPSAC